MTIYQSNSFYAHNSSSPLEEAIRIAVEAHAGQVDKGGESYILHPLRVMNRMDSAEAKIVAVLHDVLEDSSLTREDLLGRGIPEAEVAVVEVLTRTRKQPYTDYILQIIRAGRVPTRVKIADLRDNLRVERLGDRPLTPKDVERLDRYRAALRVLLDTGWV